MARRWGRTAAAGAIAGGLLIDADHLIDFGITKLTGARRYYVAPFHAWELAALAGAAAAWAGGRAHALRQPPDTWLPEESLLDAVLGARGWAVVSAVAAGAALGGLVHLAHDVVSNRPKHPGTYSLLYRIKGRFDRDAVGWGEHPDFHGWSRAPWWQWF